MKQSKSDRNAALDQSTALLTSSPQAAGSVAVTLSADSSLKLPTSYMGVIGRSVEIPAIFPFDFKPSPLPTPNVAHADLRSMSSTSRPKSVSRAKHGVSVDPTIPYSPAIKLVPTTHGKALQLSRYLEIDAELVKKSQNSRLFLQNFLTPSATPSHLTPAA